MTAQTTTERVRERNARLTARFQAKGWHGVSEVLTAFLDQDISVPECPPEVVARRRPARKPRKDTPRETSVCTCPLVNDQSMGLDPNCPVHYALAEYEVAVRSKIDDLEQQSKDAPAEGSAA